MSGYKDYLSEEMQGAIETPTKSKRTRLSQFRHGGYHSSMDEFFTAGKKSYGVRNVDVDKLGKYGSTGRTGNPRFSTLEFFGKTFMSNGGEVTVYNNPGNLEKGQGYAGETGNTYADDRERPFVIFDSPEMGVRALAMDLQTKIKRHEGDVDKIIAQYAPDNENDTKKYQEFVKEKLKKDKVTNKDLKFLVQAIIEKENKPEVADYYLDNPDIIKKGLAMSYFQLPKGISLEQAMNEISAKEATLKKVLKKKPQMNEGGSVKKQMAEALNEDAPKGERLAYINSQEEKMLRDAGGSGELTEAGIPSYRGHTDSHGGGGGSGSGGNTGGRGPGDGGQRGRERQKREQERQRKEKEAKAKADREAADRRERARIATEEENRRVSEIKERERQRKADEEAANTNTTTDNVSSKTKEAAKLAASYLTNYVSSYFDTVNPLSPNTTLTPNSLISQQTLKSATTPIGDVSINRTTVRDLPLSKEGLLNPDVSYSADLKGSYKGVDYGASIDDTGDIAGGFTTDLGPGTLTGSGYYDGSDNYGGSVSYGVSFKKGGLLDRSRKK